MDDYYELLDVAPDAEREDIRLAYRAKRDEVQAQGSDDARAKVAELNRAWNVLGDAIQRQRYDGRLAESRAAGDESDDEDEGERPIPVTRAQRREEIRRARQKRIPTIELPNGLVMAPTRSRLMAMATDIVILLALFTAVSFIGGRQVDHHFPGEQTHASHLQKRVVAFSKKITADKKAISTAQNKHESAKTAQTQLTKDQNKQNAYKNQITKINEDFAPGLKLVYAIGVIVVFLYLVPLTALSGQTIGKRVQKVKVVKLADGSVPGWGVALRRFAIPFAVSMVLGVLFLQEFALLLGIVAVVGWVNRPDRQGFHDRMAKTVVVEA